MRGIEFDIFLGWYLFSLSFISMVRRLGFNGCDYATGRGFPGMSRIRSGTTIFDKSMERLRVVEGKSLQTRKRQRSTLQNLFGRPLALQIVYVSRQLRKRLSVRILDPHPETMKTSTRMGCGIMGHRLLQTGMTR